MADNSWPATIPQKPTVGGYSESPKDNTSRTEMEVGPSKMRRRSTVVATTFKCQFEMTLAEIAEFDTFFKTTLISGSLLFNWYNPRNGDAGEFRFTAPPTITADGGDNWLVNCELEMLP